MNQKKKRFYDLDFRDCAQEQLINPPRSFVTNQNSCQNQKKLLESTNRNPPNQIVNHCEFLELFYQIFCERKELRKKPKIVHFFFIVSEESRRKYTLCKEHYTKRNKQLVKQRTFLTNSTLLY